MGKRQGPIYQAAKSTLGGSFKDYKATTRILSLKCGRPHDRKSVYNRLTAMPK